MKSISIERPLSFEEAVKFLHTTHDYLRKLMYRGEVPYYRPTGGKAFFSPVELQAYIYRNRKAAKYEKTTKKATRKERARHE